MDSDGGFSVNRAQLATYTHKIYHFNFNKKTVTQQFKSFKKTINIIQYNDSLDWQIHNEFKEIQGHQVQKATVAYSFNFIVKNEITAWFARDLPFPIGPIGISGLPRAILEVEKNGVFYYAADIKISKKEISIPSLKEGRIMTSEEYQKAIKNHDVIMKEYMENQKK